MKIYFVTTIITLFSLNLAFCQKGFNKDYYQNLKSELLKDSAISDVRLNERKYNNGIQKRMFVMVKFKNDSINRYWTVGKLESYYKNGHLKESSIYDLKSKFIGGNYTYFRKNGKVLYEIDFYEHSCGYYTTKYFTSYFKLPDIGLGKFYLKDGRLSVEGELKYDYRSKFLKLNGFRKIYRYSKTSTKIIEQQYVMGKRISSHKQILVN
jgi:hypothetical protein